VATLQGLLFGIPRLTVVCTGSNSDKCCRRG
jgi:hypothetical protein